MYVGAASVAADTEEIGSTRRVLALMAAKAAFAENRFIAGTVLVPRVAAVAAWAPCLLSGQLRGSLLTLGSVTP